jgi:hypothetical protein
MPQLLNGLFLLVIVSLCVQCCHSVYLWKNGYFFREGTIVEKDFEPACTEVYWDVMLERMNTRRIPDRFYFTLEKSVGEEEILSKRKIQVSRKAYHTFNVGDYYDW